MMAIHEAEPSLINQSRFLINNIELKISDLSYSSRGNNRVCGFVISVKTQMDRHLGNVEYIQLYLKEKLIATGWAIVHQDNMHYWRFCEVVSYSPWWPNEIKEGNL